MNKLIMTLIILSLTLGIIGCGPKPEIIDENKIIFIGGSDSNYYAFDAKSMNILWRFKTKSLTSSCPVIYNDVIYIASQDSNLYALLINNGIEKWHFKTHGRIRSSPIIYNTTLYFGSGDDTLYALDAITGTVKWKYGVGSYVGSPTPYNNSIIFGSGDNYIYSVDANTGLEKWKYLTNNNLIVTNPTIENNTVCFGNIEKKIYALDATTGSLRWSYTTLDGVQQSSSAENNVLYTGDVLGYLYANNISDGSIKWIDTLVNEFGYLTDPTAKDNVVYVAGGGRIIAVKAINKDTVWLNRELVNYRYNYFPTGLTVANDKVYIGCGNGKAYGLKITTGEIIDSFTTEGAFYPINGAVISGPVILSEKGKVYYPPVSGNQK